MRTFEYDNDYIMNIKINDHPIPEVHQHHLKMAYTNIYTDFLRKKEELNKEWEDLYPVLIELEIIQEEKTPKRVKEFSNTSDMYKPLIDKVTTYHILVEENKYNADKWSWFDKCRYILEAVDSPLTSKEIMELMLGYYEPSLERQKLSNSVPATLSTATADNKLIRSKRENGEYEYIINKNKNNIVMSTEEEYLKV